MFELITRTRLNDLHFCHDESSGLNAIIAIHNTRLGPALGGCRCLHYAAEQGALMDAISLARSMSYKAALAGLPQGGGKAVILLPAGAVDREALFRAFGRFVDSLGGRYITAVDSGTELQDLDVVATQTRHVVGTGQDGYDPSPMTARGVLAGIRASVRARLQREELEGLTVAIQGVGHVGTLLAELLSAQGVQLVLSDIDSQRASAIAERLGARQVASDIVQRVSCDVFAPCALGGILNARTIPQLQCSIVAGAANNQLATAADGRRLLERNILYAPDYLINAGGLIRLSLVHNGAATSVEQRVDAIGNMLEDIYARQKREHLPTDVIADRLAESLIYGEG